MKVKEESEKVGLKLNIQKTKIMASGPISSVQFSHSVMSDSLRHHEPQHARPPCSSPPPGVHSDSHPSSPRCHPAISSSVVPFSSCPQSLPASVFSNKSTLCMRWPKYWSFSLEHPGLISFRMDWLDLLAVQGTRNNLLQHHSSKASILLCSAFFTVQLSHPYMTTGKTIAVLVYSEKGKISGWGVWLIRIYPSWGKKNGDESLEIHMTNSSLKKQRNKWNFYILNFLVMRFFSGDFHFWAPGHDLMLSSLA